MKPSLTPLFSPPHRAFTLLELLLALFTLSIVGVAVCSLTFGAMNTDRYVRSSTTGQSEVEFAMRRIANNLREAQTGTITVGTSTFSVTTQPDTADGFPNGATVSYALQADPSQAGQQVLIETDQRYGANTVAHNVTTFTVTAVAGVTNLYKIDLVLGTEMVCERHFQAFNRN